MPENRTLNGVPFLWDEEADRKLLGGLFGKGQGRQPIAGQLSQVAPKPMSGFADSPFGENWHLDDSYARTSAAVQERGHDVGPPGGLNGRDTAPLDPRGIKATLFCRKNLQDVQTLYDQYYPAPDRIGVYVKLYKNFNITAYDVITNDLKKDTNFDSHAIETLIGVRLGMRLAEARPDKGQLKIVIDNLCGWLFKDDQPGVDKYGPELYRLALEETSSGYDALGELGNIVLALARSIAQFRDALAKHLGLLAAKIAELKLDDPAFWYPDSTDFKGNNNFRPLFVPFDNKTGKPIKQTFAELNAFLANNFAGIDIQAGNGATFVLSVHKLFLGPLEALAIGLEPILETAEDAIFLFNAFVTGLYNGCINFMAGAVKIAGLLVELCNVEKLKKAYSAIANFCAEIVEKGVVATIVAWVKQIFAAIRERYSSTKSPYELAKNLGEDLSLIIVDAIMAVLTGGTSTLEKAGGALKKMAEALAKPEVPLHAIRDFITLSTEQVFTYANLVSQFIARLPLAVRKWVWELIDQKICEPILFQSELYLTFHKIPCVRINAYGHLLNLRLYNEIENYSLVKTLKNVEIEVRIRNKDEKIITQLFKEDLEVLKTPKCIQFRAVHKEGTKRDARLVNEIFERGNQVPPYKIGEMVTDMTLKKGDKIYILEFLNEQKNFGGFASKYQVKSIKEAREILAIKKAWKDEAFDQLVVREYEVKTDLRVREDGIGEVYDEQLKKVLKGGGQQYEFMERMNDGVKFEERSWRKFLDRTNNDLKLQ